MFTKKDIKQNMRRGEALLITVTVIMALVAGAQLYYSNFQEPGECVFDICKDNTCESQTCESHSNKASSCHK